MYLLQIAGFLGTISLLLSVALFLWAIRIEGPGKEIGKFFGIILTAITILGMICLLYYGMRDWHQGYFDNPTMMHAKMMAPQA